jgi:hypothetical protein
LFAPSAFIELLSRQLPAKMRPLMLNKFVTRLFQLQHVSVAATAIIRESFYIENWNTAGVRQDGLSL